MSRSRMRGLARRCCARCTVTRRCGARAGRERGEDVSGGRPAGGHRQGDQGRGRRHDLERPDGWVARVGVRRSEGVLQVHQHEGWGLRAQARARLEARRRSREQPLGSPRAARRRTTSSPCCRSRCSCSPAPGCWPTTASRRSAGTSTRNGVRRTTSPVRRTSSPNVGDFICFTCALPERADVAAQEARAAQDRRARVQRAAVDGVRRGPGEQLQEVPDREDRVPRQEHHVRQRRLQRAGRPDEGQGRRHGHLVSRRERCDDAWHAR